MAGVRCGRGWVGPRDRSADGGVGGGEELRVRLYSRSPPGPAPAPGGDPHRGAPLPPRPATATRGGPKLSALVARPPPISATGRALSLLAAAYVDTLGAIVGRSYLSAAALALLFLNTLGLARGGEGGGAEPEPTG